MLDHLICFGWNFTILKSVGFEVLKALVMKSTVISGLTLCIESHSMFQKNMPPSSAESKSKSSKSLVWSRLCLQPASCWVLPCLPLQPWSWRWRVSLKHQWTFCQTTQHFIPADGILHLQGCSAFTWQSCNTVDKTCS
jgi:hypothetical protein